MSAKATTTSLIGPQLSSFYLEKLEFPTGSGQLSEFPIRAWVCSPEERQAVEISTDSAGCRIRLAFGTPRPFDIGEDYGSEDYGSIVIVPPFVDSALQELRVESAALKPVEMGEKLTILL